MVALHYAPGRAHLVATHAAVVLIDADVPTELLTRLWQQVGEGRGLAAVLEALAGAFGTSLTAIPPFLVAVTEADGVRLAVRGEIAVTATAGAGPMRLSGAGVTTWSEQVVRDITRAEVVLDGVGTDDARLPLRDGVVRAGAVVVEWTRPAAAEAVAESAIREDATHAGGAAEQPGIDTWIPHDATLIPELRDTDGTPTPPHGTPLDSALGDASTSPAPLAPPTTGLDPAEVGDTVVSVRVRGDHDGETISLAQARALREGAAPPARSAPRGGILDSVPEPLAPPRPAAPGRLRLSTGQLVALDRTVVIGRRPRSTRVTGTDLPHLIAVESPEQDISRSHLEVRVEGDSILATDLHTTNGTTLRRAGAEPVRLHPGERNVVVPGDVLDLGDGITVTVEDIA
jgi:hypothetical protein